MPLIITLIAILISYGIGSIPFGLLIVRLGTGQDIRNIESGRTGGTNAMRAAGFWAGLFTVVLDVLKGASSVWLFRWLSANSLIPNSPMLTILSPLATILGHNYSIFLIEKDEKGKVRLRGGAGGTPALGGTFGLWAPSLFFTLTIGGALLFGLGYASVATLSIGLVSTLIFAYRAWLGVSPWEYILYGVFSFLLLAWALRPNIQRLINGTERLVGWRAKKKRQKEGQP